jgi:hypothetical protein
MGATTRSKLGHDRRERNYRVVASEPHPLFSLGSMLCRGLVAMIFLAVVAFAFADQDQPLSEAELTEFLGPGKTSLMTWSVVPGPDFVVYYGKAKPPLSGGVGIYLGGWPSFEPDPSSTVVSGQLGIFPVKWRRNVLPEGGIRQEAVIPLDEDYLKAHVWLDAQQQGDLDKLLGELSHLPTFSFKHESPFHDEIVKERRSRIAVCLLAFGIFGCSVWLLDRRIRRRQGSTLRRGLVLAGISVGWFLLMVGLGWFRFPFLASSIGVDATRWGFWIMFALAAIGLVVGLLVASVSWILGRRAA